MKQKKAEQTYLRILSSYYECTSCKSYRLLLSIPANGTNARSLVLFGSLKNRWAGVELRTHNRTPESTDTSNHAPLPTALPADVIGWTNTDRTLHPLASHHEWTRWEENWAELEGSLLWGLYRTAPTLIVYKTSYPHAILQKVRSDTKKWKKWLSRFRTRTPKSQLSQHACKHATKLIPSAGIPGACTVKVAGKSAQWLSRTKQNTHGEKVPHSSPWGTPKSTCAIRIRTRHKANTICGHMLGVYRKSLGRIGPVVRENEAKYAWGESSPWGTSPFPMGNPKISFCSSHQTGVKT